MKTKPDKWIIVSISKDDEDVIYKVFASWAGGYLSGDSWRLNSGIKSITKSGNDYIITGYSGSEYVCGESGYGIIGSHNQMVLENMKADARKKGYMITELDKSVNFNKLIK